MCRKINPVFLTAHVNTCLSDNQIFFSDSKEKKVFSTGLCFLLLQLFRPGFSALIIFLLFFSSSGMASGQSIRFRAFFGKEPVEWDNKVFRSAAGETFRFSQLAFYLSDFSWYGDDGQILHESSRVELLKADSEQDSMQIRATGKPKRLCFRLGLDSATQVSGETRGPLDPALGMYWAWNTGYIQCKLEGVSSASGGKNGQFEFHLGGYRSPCPTDFPVCLSFAEAYRNQEIRLNLKPLMDAVSLKKNWSVISPGEQANRMVQIIANAFETAETK